jgi:putative hydrolase of the HAD superfamily
MPESLKAVIFDYGGVLCFHPPEQEVEALAGLCGLPANDFQRIYWSLRPPYDRGDLDGPAYWQAFADAAERSYTREEVGEFIRRDVAFWLHLDRRMVDWIGHLRARGLRIGLLSNMPRDLGEHLRLHTDLLRQFDHVTFSYEVRAVKPDASIYRDATEGLGVAPREALFIDDRSANVEAAAALGIHGVVFESPGQLAEALSRNGLADDRLQGIVQSVE